MLHNFGRVVDYPRINNAIDYKLDFLYEGIRRSLFTITMEADSLKTIINRYFSVVKICLNIIATILGLLGV